MSEGYDPEWLELETTLGQRPLLIGDVDYMVKQYNALGAMLGEQWGPPSDAVQARDEKINDHVTVRIYTPTPASQKKEQEPLPVGLYYHGGGYISGDLDFEDPICRIISEKTPCVLVSVDYRLAPKYKLPTGIDDGYDAFLWLGIQAHDNASKLNGNPAAYFTIGGSAGGGIALAVTDKLIRNGKRHLVHGTVAMNPITTHMDNPPEKYKYIYTSYTEYAANNAAVIDRHCMDVSFDILRDDGIVLERVLRDAGVKRVKRDHYVGFPHYFFVFPSVKTGRTFLLNVLRGVRSVLGLEE
ncbi:hypothetical protein VTN00DRAFT_7801 [Thermoascus crustaceus]|uniref:uncharacterized protein n=1 Tax=Thermoascus crustaceus TaxID=5088 RepID=UPI003744101E